MCTSLHTCHYLIYVPLFIPVTIAYMYVSSYLLLTQMRTSLHICHYLICVPLFIPVTISYVYLSSYLSLSHRCVPLAYLSLSHMYTCLHTCHYLICVLSSYLSLSHMCTCLHTCHYLICVPVFILSRPSAKSTVTRQTRSSEEKEIKYLYLLSVNISFRYRSSYLSLSHSNVFPPLIPSHSKTCLYV